MPETLKHLLGYTLYLACDTRVHKDLGPPTGTCPISFITEQGRLVRIVRSWDTDSPNEVVECTPMYAAAGLLCVLWPSVSHSSRVMTTTMDLLHAGVRAHDTSLMRACPVPVPVRFGDNHVIPVVVSSIDRNSMVIYAAHICGVSVTLHGVTRVGCDEWVLPDPKDLAQVLGKREQGGPATPPLPLESTSALGPRSYPRPPQARPRATSSRRGGQAPLGIGALGAIKKERGPR